jgi:hypothetical protein
MTARTKLFAVLYLTCKTTAPELALPRTGFRTGLYGAEPRGLSFATYSRAGASDGPPVDPTPGRGQAAAAADDPDLAGLGGIFSQRPGLCYSRHRLGHSGRNPALAARFSAPGGGAPGAQRHSMPRGVDRHGGWQRAARQWVGCGRDPLSPGPDPAQLGLLDQRLKRSIRRDH